MKSVPFMKMSGVGNDFIIIDNRENLLQDIEVHHLARKVCQRRESLGGDGLILIERSALGGDLFMRTINPDGTGLSGYYGHRVLSPDAPAHGGHRAGRIRPDDHV